MGRVKGCSKYPIKVQSYLQQKLSNSYYISTRLRNLALEYIIENEIAEFYSYGKFPYLLVLLTTDKGYQFYTPTKSIKINVKRSFNN